MKKSDSKIINFVKSNALYLVLAFCLIAVGLSVTLMLLTENKSVKEAQSQQVEEPINDDPTGQDDPTDPIVDPVNPVVKTVTFIMPVASSTEINGYTEQMVFNSTLKRYSAHTAVDFIAPEGTDVFCVYEGIVESVENSLLNGTKITVNHGNGLKTVYSSLLDGDSVSKGQTVKQGDVIGQVSNSDRQEAYLGNHLHFETLENGTVIDPAKYLDFQEK